MSRCSSPDWFQTVGCYLSSDCSSLVDFGLSSGCCRLVGLLADYSGLGCFQIGSDFGCLGYFAHSLARSPHTTQATASL